MESTFVQVPVDLKGYVVGRGGYRINQIMEESGAIISSLSREEEGFTVIGNEEQLACAVTLLLETVEEAKLSKWELVEIPDGYKGRVMGKGGARLKEISEQTGASLTRKGGEVYIIHGTEKQRQHARVNIGDIVASARLKGVENEFFKARCYVDGCYLPEHSKLKLEKVLEEDRISLPGPHSQQYRLKPVEEHKPKDVFSQWNNTSYQSDLVNDVLDSLRKIKDEMETTENPKADMWCHLGTSIVRGPDEGDVHKEMWSIDEAKEMLQSSDGGNYWKVTFRERVDLEEDIFRRHFQEKTLEDDAYIARYDLTFLTPCFHYLRCKIWVAKESVQKKLKDVPIPFSDVKNVLEEIPFKDRKTQSRCRGWLVLKSRKYLQSDILFPGCEFDCRLTIRERTDHVHVTDDVPEENVRRILTTYLSGLTLAEEDSFGLRIEDKEIPEGFYLIHKRCCERTMYTSDNPGFSIILSKENSKSCNISGQKESRESTDLHLHCDECDELLSSNDWEPEDIVRKLPNFIQFVKDVQRIVINEMERQGSLLNIPPEILARGQLALEAYNNALAEGEAFVKRVPLMLIGQTRSGKTSLKKSLRGIRFNPDEDSTVGIEVDCYDFKVTTEIWKTGKKDEEANSDAVAISFEHNAARLVAERLREEESVTERRKTGFASESSFDLEIPEMNMDTQLSESSEGPGPIDTSEHSTPTDVIDDPSLEAIDAVPDSKKTRQDNDLPFTTKVPDFEEVAVITEKLLQSDELENQSDIYSLFWDFAGQSVYYTTHPLFLTRRAIYFLVYDLSQNPHEKAKPLVKQGVYKKFEDNFNLKTNLDYLDFWMTSVTSLAKRNDINDVSSGTEPLANELPAVFLVCTHADEPYDGRDPQELANEIFGSLTDKPYGPHLSDVFIVDNTKSGSECECEEVARLREAVLDVAKELPYMNEAIPVKWLKYEKALQMLKKGEHKCISLAQAKNIASKVCSIEKENEINTLLNFLHDLRILIHFDDTPELNNVVVLDPQWLIDVFKKVITVKPYHWTEKKFVKLWCKLEKDGILENKLLEHVWNPLIRDKQTSESFIAIMEKFGLLCLWPFSDVSCPKQYLVPSMLKSHPPEAIKRLVASAQIPSLYFQFESGQVPPGFFPRLVLQFYQHGKETLWWQGSPKLYQGFARFHVSGDEDCSVILLCHSSSIEVVYHRGSFESMEVLQPEMTLSTDLDCNPASFTATRAVCRQLCLILECMRNQFCWLNNMRYSMSVICPVCCQGNAVRFCDTHNKEGCEEEECLHFWSECELRSASGNVICTKSASAQDTRIKVKYWTAWFSSPGEQMTLRMQCERLSLEEKANDERTLALPDEVQVSLLSKTSDCKEVVCQLEKSLGPEQATLKDPDAGTKVLIRSLARKAKFSNRLDVVKHLRKIVPAGTTGPLTSESLNVRKIPFPQRRKLTISLSGGDEWKFVAERLGLTPDEIRFLDNRTLNPADSMLSYVARQYNITVGDLYDLLNDCDLPVMADHL